jgi:hypothetical protein
MADLAHDSVHAPTGELAPARALLTPTWLAALALLVANDHWLKGAGLIPDVLTGKLSDFAGMLVAPVLLASLLRIRSRRALLACHVAVAAVFTGIQLSPGFAATWSALMGLVGHPWVITCDPTDLIALPFLGLSWALLVPAMDPSKPALAPIQRTAVASVSVFGLWATVATSESGIDPGNEWYEDVYGNVYINNANDFEITLHVRPLRSDVQIDCSEVAVDPGRLLRSSAFGDAEHWRLPERTNIGIELAGAEHCGAVMIAGEGIPPIIVFAHLHAVQPQWFPGQVFNAPNLGNSGLGVVFGDHGGEWVGNDALRFTPRNDAPELPPSCEAPAAEQRLDWSVPVPKRKSELLSITAGVDGCYALEVQELSVVEGEQMPYGSPYPFYLCAHEAAVPFVPGERLEFKQTLGSGGERQLEITLLDEHSLAVAVDQLNVPLRRVHYLRGGPATQWISSSLDRDVVAVHRVSCPWQAESGCATVERPVDLGTSGGGFFSPGEPVVFADETFVRTAVLAYARQRAVVDASCSDSTTRLHYDIDFVLIDESAL